MVNTLSKDSVVVATKQSISADLSEDAVILSLEENVYYGLNPVGAQIWSLIQEPRSLGAVLDALLEEFDVDEATCETDLHALITEMLGRKLVEIRDEQTG